MTLHEVKLIIGGSEVSLFIQCAFVGLFTTGEREGNFTTGWCDCIRNQQYQSISDVTSAFMFSWCES